MHGMQHSTSIPYFSIFLPGVLSAYVSYLLLESSLWYSVVSEETKQYCPSSFDFLRSQGK